MAGVARRARSSMITSATRAPAKATTSRRCTAAAPCETGRSGTTASAWAYDDSTTLIHSDHRAAEQATKQRIHDTRDRNHPTVPQADLPGGRHRLPQQCAIRERGEEADAVEIMQPHTSKLCGHHRGERSCGVAPKMS